MESDIKISVVIITYNEESHIGACIDSCSPVADEVVILDSFSTDQTVALAKAKGAKVYQEAFNNFVEQKNKAIDYADHDWVLSIDADERLEKALADQILSIKKNPSYNAYRFNRLNNYCGKWIKHGGWYPEWKLRLWHKNYGSWAGNKVHEKVQLKEGEKEGKLNGHLLHFTYTSIAQHLHKMNQYSSLAAEAMKEEGKSTSIFKMVLSTKTAFIKQYFLKFGWRDGFYGLVIAMVGAFGKFAKYAKLHSYNKQK